MFLNHNIQALPEHPSIAGFFRVCDPNLLQCGHGPTASELLTVCVAPTHHLGFGVRGLGLRVWGLGEFGTMQPKPE